MKTGMRQANFHIGPGLFVLLEKIIGDADLEKSLCDDRVEPFPFRLPESGLSDGKGSLGVIGITH